MWYYAFYSSRICVFVYIHIYIYIYIYTYNIYTDITYFYLIIMITVLSKMMWAVGIGTLNRHKSRGCSFDYFSVIKSRTMKKWCSLILICIPTKFGCCSFIEIFNLPSDHVISSRDMEEWYRFILVSIPTMSDDCSLRKSCDMMLLISHVIKVRANFIILTKFGWHIFFENLTW